MEFYGIKGIVLKWVQSYLANGRIFTRQGYVPGHANMYQFGSQELLYHWKQEVLCVEECFISREALLVIFYNCVTNHKGVDSGRRGYILVGFIIYPQNIL